MVGRAQTSWTYFPIEISWNIPYVKRPSIVCVCVCVFSQVVHTLFSVRLKVTLLTEVSLIITSDFTQLSTVHILKLVACNKFVVKVFY